MTARIVFVVVSFLTIFLLFPRESVADTIVKDVVVSARHPWTDTGLDLSAGSFLTVRARGTIHISFADFGTSPAGKAGCIAGITFVAPGLTCYSLIGRIGNGAAFPVGANLESFRVPSSGRFFLGVNDELLFFFDNSSSWNAHIIYNFFPTPPPPSGPSPFLDLPWDYEEKGLSFTEAALSINAYFDHEYPLLSSGLEEPVAVSDSILKYEGQPRTNEFYSSHDGYDYGKRANANLGDPVLAAAAGCASYRYSPAGGNMILIDHGNHYQTRYLHLQCDGLITQNASPCVQVTKGQHIGKVGATGNVSPPGEAGAHIHFTVIEDKNKDGDFDDNIPDGVTDPFGWQSKEPDPWPAFVFDYAGQERTGNKSFYLWLKKLARLATNLTSAGGTFELGRFTISFPSGATNQTLTLDLQSSPIANPSSELSSVGSTVIVTAKDALGNIVDTFQNFFTVTVDFNSIDLTRYNLDTLSIYSSEDGVNWSEEPTTIDEKTTSAQVDHLTHFALMAERIDTTPPTTTANLTGLQGQPNWFRSDVEVSLTAQDNEGGLGVDYTLYKLEGEDWQEYTTPLAFTNEGHYKIEFYSVDNDENIEDVKSLELDIDKTSPQASINANHKELWPPNGKMVDVRVTGSSSDEHLYQTTIMVEDEYNLVEPAISGFGQTIQLEAAREGSDKDGRRYIMKVVAEDLSGNITEEQVEVLVPHDQGEEE